MSQSLIEKRIQELCELPVQRIITILVNEGHNGFFVASELRRILRVEVVYLGKGCFTRETAQS